MGSGKHLWSQQSQVRKENQKEFKSIGATEPVSRGKRGRGKRGIILILPIYRKPHLTIIVKFH